MLTPPTSGGACRRTCTPRYVRPGQKRRFAHAYVWHPTRRCPCSTRSVRLVETTAGVPVRAPTGAWPVGSRAFGVRSSGASASFRTTPVSVRSWPRVASPTLTLPIVPAGPHPHCGARCAAVVSVRSAALKHGPDQCQSPGRAGGYRRARRRRIVRYLGSESVSAGMRRTPGRPLRLYPRWAGRADRARGLRLRSTCVGS
jgi:hypothetical protein